MIDIACERTDRIQPVIEPITLMTTIILSLDTAPTTRIGVNNMCDYLFALEALSPVLKNPEIYQPLIQNALSGSSRLVQDYWTHIIRPAWDQYVAR